MRRRREQRSGRTQRSERVASPVRSMCASIAQVESEAGRRVPRAPGGARRAGAAKPHSKLRRRGGIRAARSVGEPKLLTRIAAARFLFLPPEGAATTE